MRKMLSPLFSYLLFVLKKALCCLTWLYRITYSPKDKVSNSEEITVSFHRDYVQIGSEFYLAKQGVDYDDVLEWAKSKHEYLVKEYGAE